jgi:hypothetical protein
VEYFINSGISRITVIEVPIIEDTIVYANITRAFIREKSSVSLLEEIRVNENVV